VEELAIGALAVTLDVHVSEASPRGIPLDARASPLALPPLAALRLWCAGLEPPAKTDACRNALGFWTRCIAPGSMHMNRAFRVREESGIGELGCSARVNPSKQPESISQSDMLRI